jgi:hypothetical protein
MVEPICKFCGGDEELNRLTMICERCREQGFESNMTEFEFWIESTSETRKVMCHNKLDAEREAVRLSNYSQGDVRYSPADSNFTGDWVLYVND